MTIRSRGTGPHQSHGWNEHESLDDAQDRFVDLRVAGCTTIVVEVDGDRYRWTRNRIAHKVSMGWTTGSSPFGERTAKAEKYAIQTT